MKKRWGAARRGGGGGAQKDMGASREWSRNLRASTKFTSASSSVPQNTLANNVIFFVRDIMVFIGIPIYCHPFFSSFQLIEVYSK